MSVDVSQTENLPGAPPAADPSDPRNLFTAFQAGGSRLPRGRWTLALVTALFPVVLGVGVWTLIREDSTTFRVLTPHGIKSVHGGMTTEQVVALLGKPMTRERDAGGADCYRYGQPSMEKEFFLVYAVCYESGKLRDVKMQKYSAWSVDPEQGTFDAPGGAPPAASPSSTAGSR
ncbi:hypothetical protein LZ198_27025 [Myxococcus sp. K15C18031901]|uniref:hypothetical protein n=1 Tax=Myxococcus dinghuensis TaxID=2906761 RepID=UPI0020A7FA1B|nr:hypothetical protein [Myxococcus dinghuensis]MCP3102532.1 hypothetical protein [Myxococcus dinghuensis]